MAERPLARLRRRPSSWPIILPLHPALRDSRAQMLSREGRLKGVKGQDDLPCSSRLPVARMRGKAQRE